MLSYDDHQLTTWVVIRFRPPNALELREGGDIVVQVDDDNTTVRMRSQETMKGPEAAGFAYDRVFGMTTRQEEVFEYGVRGIVDGVCFTDLLKSLNPWCSIDLHL